MKSAKEILYELVGVQSDTGTAMERNVAAKILGLIKEDPYFQSHPDLCGSYLDKDILDRPVVWALKKGTGRKTLIISGHYDVVEIKSYGSLEEYALKPDLLKKQMKAAPASDPQLKRDLESDDWMFGRGGCDMKGGLAAGLYALMSYTPGEANVLYAAVSDEENLSAGARMAVGLFAMLKEKYDLDYCLDVICEPSGRNPDEDEPYPLVGGSVGKILPVVMVKGRLAHACYMLNGLNSTAILAEVIRNVEMSTDFLSADLGVSNQPPTALMSRDLKDHYDVSMPEYSAAAFNMTFLKSTEPMDLVATLKTKCEASLDTVIARYNAVVDEMIQARSISEDIRVEYTPAVMTLDDLRKGILESKPGFVEFEKGLDKRTAERLASGKTIQEVSIDYIRELVDFSEIVPPAIVIGIAPPYYPAVNNSYLGKDIAPMLEAIKTALKTRHGMNTVDVAYALGMTDMSYTQCTDPAGSMAVQSIIGLTPGVYYTDFTKLADLNIPTLILGPAGRGIHQPTERVYLPDVEKNIPTILAEMIRVI